MKAECGQHRERFSEYLDGQMAGAGRKALEAHLADCAECRGELELWRRTIRAVSELPEHRVPAGFGERVAQSIGAGQAPAGGRRLTVLWARVLPVAAMLMLVLGLLVSVPGGWPAERGAPARRLAMARRAAAPEAPLAARAERPEETPTTGLPVAAPAEAREMLGRDRLEAAAARPVGRLAGAVGGGMGQPPGIARSVQAVAERDAAAVHMRDEEVPAEAPALTWGEPGAEEQMAQRLQDLGRPFVFTQTASTDMADAKERAQQVLTFVADEPTDLMRRAVATANSAGLTATLLVEPDGEHDGGVDVYLAVPPAQYGPLLRELVNLTPPDRQALSNTAAASGPFFDEMLLNYAFLKDAWEAEGKPEKANEAQVVGLRVVDRSLGGTGAAGEMRTAAERRSRAPTREEGLSGSVAAPVGLIIHIRKSSAPLGPAEHGVRAVTPSGAGTATPEDSPAHPAAPARP